MESKGIRVNMGRQSVWLAMPQWYPQGRQISLQFICHKGVGSSLIYCKGWVKYWVQKKHIKRMGRLRNNENNRCRNCAGEIGVNDGPQVEHVMVDGVALEVFDKFCYLGWLVLVVVLWECDCQNKMRMEKVYVVLLLALATMEPSVLLSFGSNISSVCLISFS